MKSIHRIAATVVSTALLGLPAGTAEADGATIDVNPTPIPTTVEVKNHMRGQYELHGMSKTPDLTGNDVNDRTYWREIESADQVFNATKIEAGLAKAESRGGVYGFRVMAVCEWCDDAQVALPDFMRDDEGVWLTPGGGNDINEQPKMLEIPDWNSEEFLSQWEELMVYLGDTYDGDPRLGWVDVGGYGNWGEWHTYPWEGRYPGPDGQTDITLESAKRMIDAVVDNFPTTPVVLNTTGSRPAELDGTPIPENQPKSFAFSNEIWQYYLGLDDRLGIRNDCLGAGQEQLPAKLGLLEASRHANEIGGIDPLERWKTAPFITEWCGATRPPADLNGNGVIDEWERHDRDGNGEIEEWEAAAAYGSFDKGLEQVEDWHISMLSSSNYTGELAEFPEADQEYFVEANLRSGYRYVIDNVTGTLGDDSALTTTWSNVNVAPAYHPWDVVYEVRDSSGSVVASVTSSVDLRTVLPGEPVEVTDSLDLAALPEGEYQLSVKVTDPEDYLAPLTLAIEGRTDDGSYPLTTFTLTDDDTPSTDTPTYEATAPYTLAGNHTINGREWRTTCEKYSQTERCRAEIWASIVNRTGNTYSINRGWAFNNLTYLPYMKRAQWATNPLGHTGTWTAADNRQWRTVCDTPATGRNGCRSYAMVTTYTATPITGQPGRYTFSQDNTWVFNNIVLFGGYRR